MRDIKFQYNFYAVGQGLFTSGHLFDYKRQNQFHWVFDCGTLSQRSYVQREIASLTAQLKGEPIGLFCLSHFDEDHINGARDLLSRQRVDVLIMPYFPLVERIRIAFGTSGLSEEYLRFLIDPAGYMLAAAGENLGEVIMIAGGGATPEASDRGAPINPTDNPNDRWKLRLPDTKPTEPPADEDIYGVSDSSSRRAVRVLGHQQPFSISGVWEFMFYNEEIPDAKSADLRRKVADVLIKYRRADGSFDGIALLRELKQIYALEFGSSALAKNKISLVMYAGPVVQQNSRAIPFCVNLAPVSIRPDLCGNCCDICLHNPGESNASVGYFGDFPLISSERVCEIRQHFGQFRWDRFWVVQIPHHGSSHSWYAGASGEFLHKFSVISAPRHSEDHPAQSVLDDLVTHGVILVNEMQSLEFCGIV